VRSKGDHAGAVLEVYVDSQGCASNTPPTRHRIFFADGVPWQRVRYGQTFAGSASCWYVFGGQNDNRALDPNLIPFDAAKGQRATVISRRRGTRGGRTATSTSSDGAAAPCSHASPPPLRGKVAGVMKRTFLAVCHFALGLGLLLTSTGCSSTLAQPFAGMKSQPVTIYRLQNYEPPGAAALPAGLPPQIQQWLSAGAQLLPPGLLPPGLLPGGTPLPSAMDAPRFHNFRILGSMAVTDKTQHDDVIDLFGKESNFEAPRQSCMYAEFGFQIGYGSAPGTTPAGGQPPADVLVSLSCDQVQMFNYAWPHGAKNGLTSDSAKKIVAMVQKAFGG